VNVQFKDSFVKDLRKVKDKAALKRVKEVIEQAEQARRIDISHKCLLSKSTLPIAKFQILRLTPQNDIATQSLDGGGFGQS